MRRIRDPQQKWMFDPFEGVLSPLARNRIQTGWQGLFRTVVLELLPVKQLSTHFSPDMGCPTKELYSMAGLVFLADFFDWNALETADAYMMRSDIQFSLNIEPGVECSDRTVERYRKLFTEDDLASQLFCDLTIKLTNLLELDVSKQRLDSTHIFSHMATFGRVRLMAVTLKRCLTQIKRHEAKDYEALPEDLRARYASSESRLFAVPRMSKLAPVRSSRSPKTCSWSSNALPITRGLTAALRTPLWCGFSSNSARSSRGAWW